VDCLPAYRGCLYTCRTGPSPRHRLRRRRERRHLQRRFEQLEKHPLHLV